MLPRCILTGWLSRHLKRDSSCWSDTELIEEKEKGPRAWQRISHPQKPGFRSSPLCNEYRQVLSTRTGKSQLFVSEGLGGGGGVFMQTLLRIKEQLGAKSCAGAGQIQTSGFKPLTSAGSWHKTPLNASTTFLVYRSLWLHVSTTLLFSKRMWRC